MIKNFKNRQAHRCYLEDHQACTLRSRHHGFYLDVGANNGIFKSKTIALEDAGWKGICIEANPIIFEDLKINRGHRNTLCVNECLVSEAHSGKEVEFYVGDASGVSCGIIPDDSFIYKEKFRWKSGDRNIKIKGKSLRQTLDENRCPKRIEYAKFDIEGAETEILSDFSFDKYCFLFLVIELANDVIVNKLYDNGYFYIGAQGEDGSPPSDDFFIHRTNPFAKTYVERAFENRDTKGY